MKNNIKKILTHVMLGAAMATTSFFAAFTAVSCSKQDEPTKVEESMQVSDAMLIGDAEENGISVMSTKLRSGDYGDYGVSATAESAYILSATILPSDAGNQELDWTITWVNPNSTWAKGKTVTDYVTVVPVTAGAKTATVSCFQAFGEQIKITVKSKGDYSKFANCMVDYAQRVENVQLNFGNVPINLGGVTTVKSELCPTETGPGGEVYAQIETSDVYTVAENFTKKVTLENVKSGSETVYFRLASGHPSAMAFSLPAGETNWYGEDIYYDFQHDICSWFIMAREGDLLVYNLPTGEIAEQFDGITESTMYSVKFEVAGKYNSFTYTSTVKCGGYTNATAVASVSLDYMSYVF